MKRVNTLLGTPMGRLRVTTLVEGISYVFLVGVAMPRKYGLQLPGAVKVGGWIHGVLFVAVMAALAEVFFRRQLSFVRSAVVVIATLLPLGAFVIDRRLRESWVPPRDSGDAA